MSNESYNDLIDASKNTNAIQDDSSKVVESRYSVVIAAAKRARQIVSGDQPLAGTPDEKPLSVAVDASTGTHTTCTRRRPSISLARWPKSTVVIRISSTRYTTNLSRTHGQA